MSRHAPWMPLVAVGLLVVGLNAYRSPGPTPAAVQTELGIAYFRAGQTTLARDALSRALAADPAQHRALYALGMLNARAHRYAEAREALTAFQRLQPALAEHAHVARVIASLEAQAQEGTLSR